MKNINFNSNRYDDATWTELDANYRSSQYFEKQTKGNFNWYKEITLTNPGSIYAQLPHHKTTAYWWEYTYAYGPSGSFIWNAVRER